MVSVKKNNKPLYKQFIGIRENVQSREKLLRFKKKKWALFKNAVLKQLKRYNRRKPRDQSTYVATKYANQGTSFKRRHRDKLQAIKRLRLHYGGLSKSYTIKQIKPFLRSLKKGRGLNTAMTAKFESRLDAVLCRSNLCYSMRGAKQFIFHGKVFVNQVRVRKHSYCLKAGDLISIKLKIIDKDFIVYNMKRSHLWPLPPKHLVINYKTLQIVFRGFKRYNLFPYFCFHLGWDRIRNYARML